MSDTYLIKTEKTLTRQEGDTASIVLIVPSPPNGPDMALFEVTFVVVDAEGTELIRKTTEDSTPSIVVTGQEIEIPLLVDDTVGHAGEHRWEIQVHNSTPTVHTIGRGDFVIVEQIITNPY